MTDCGRTKPKISVVAIAGKSLQERSRTVPLSTTMPSDFMNETVLPGHPDRPLPWERKEGEAVPALRVGDDRCTGRVLPV